jgi:hypothetical protein
LPGITPGPHGGPVSRPVHSPSGPRPFPAGGRGPQYLPDVMEGLPTPVGHDAIAGPYVGPAVGGRANGEKGPSIGPNSAECDGAPGTRAGATATGAGTRVDALSDRRVPSMDDLPATAMPPRTMRATTAIVAVRAVRTRLRWRTTRRATDAVTPAPSTGAAAASKAERNRRSRSRSKESSSGTGLLRISQRQGQRKSRSAQ